MFVKKRSRDQIGHFVKVGCRILPAAGPPPVVAFAAIWSVSAESLVTDGTHS
jgi:hypothetical protein